MAGSCPACPARGPELSRAGQPRATPGPGHPPWPALPAAPADDPSSGAAGPTEPPPDEENAPPASAESVAVLAETDVAIVPVTNFRSARSGVRAADIEGLATGTSPFKALVLVEEDADAILASLGLSRDDLGKRLVTVASAGKLAENLAANRGRVAFLRADQVGPSVRALAWGGKSLFGADRVKTLAKWPLTARLPGPETPAYDPADAWTMVAGGDILLDRGVSLAIQGSKRGANFPFDGGTVEITGRCKDCSPMGWDLPYTKRTGNAGVVRELVSGADIAIANFENPAPDAFRWHGKGTVFSANPKHIKGLVDAGLDWVSLANNHIGDAGRKGMLQTMENLDRYGLAHGGLGKNATAAHKATLLKAGDVTVGILGYDQIAKYYNADADTAGQRPDDRQGAQGRHQGRAQGGRRRRRRVPALGRGVPGGPLGGAAAAGPGGHRRRARTSSSATTRTGPRAWRSTRASPSGTRWATSCSTRRGPSTRWRA